VKEVIEDQVRIVNWWIRNSCSQRL